MVNARLQPITWFFREAVPQLRKNHIWHRVQVVRRIAIDKPLFHHIVRYLATAHRFQVQKQQHLYGFSYKSVIRMSIAAAQIYQS